MGRVAQSPLAAVGLLTPALAALLRPLIGMQIRPLPGTCMALPLTRPGALLVAARRPDPGNGRLIAAVSAGDPAAAQRAGERLERCDGLSV